MTADIFDDDRFELIEEAKRRLIDGTNIEDRPEEMAVIDNVLFRFWQIGWLDQLREDKGAGTCHMEVKDNLAESEGMGDVWLECDRCHWQMMLEPTTPRFKYCPNCRAEIKEETE